MTKRIKRLKVQEEKKTKGVDFPTEESMRDFMDFQQFRPTEYRA